MDGSILQLGLFATIGAMFLTLYEMGSSLRPIACPECAHCRARADADRLEQERLSREYSRRIGIRDDEDDSKLR